MPTKKKIQWENYVKKGKNFEVLIIDLVGQGFMKIRNSRDRNDGRFHAHYYRQLSASRWFDRKEAEDFIERMKALESKKPGSILRSYINYEEGLKKIRDFVKDLPKIKPKELDNEELAKLLNKTFIVIEDISGYVYNYYFYNQFLPGELLKLLERKEKEMRKRNHYFEILCASREISKIQEEKESLLKMTGKIKKNKLKLNNPKVQKMVDAHLKKFAFLGYYYFRGKKWIPTDIYKRIKEWRGKEVKEELRVLNEQKRSNQISEQIMSKLKFNEKEKILVKTLKQMALTINQFDETCNYLAFCAKKLLDETARRLGINYKELIEMKGMEILDYLKKGKRVLSQFRKELASRDHDHALIFENGQSRILIGKALKNYKNQAGEEKVEAGLREIKGEVASPGQASGRVVIVYSIHDLPKVKRGDIMVAPATVPSFIPAMEKASAIVTEQGGLLSHAAIVSRELKIPCIVGVKYLLSALKDGDEVEVDADKGVIKKL